MARSKLCWARALSPPSMQRRALACSAALLLTLALAGPAAPQTNKAALVQFYQDYLTLVSSSDYVTTSRDQPEVWDERFDGIAKNAGFTDAADAMSSSRREILSGVAICRSSRRLGGARR